MRMIVLCLMLAGCASTCGDAQRVAAACPALPPLADQPTAAQMADYAARVVELYGQCATAQTPPK